MEKPPYIVDSAKLRRYDNQNTIFNRRLWDSSWNGHQRLYDENIVSIVEQGKPGYSRVDVALSYAGNIVHDAFEGGVSWNKISRYRKSAGKVGVDWTKVPYVVDDSQEMAKCVKRAARLFGASQVGVCQLNRNWLYHEVNIPKKFQNAIVIAVEMDAEGIATSPAALATAATAVGYSKMAFILAGMGEFIRNLGYEALQCGNDTALSIPLAIDAGLGELGRNGLLITPHHGPRVRLCKIFTDLPLKRDSPITFGVKTFCQHCKRCAENCAADAISRDDEPSFDGPCPSNNPGALKWYVNAEQCYLYWWEQGTDCSTCIKVCPYNVLSTDKSTLSPQEFWESHTE